jgi:hypothetical protein
VIAVSVVVVAAVCSVVGSVLLAVLAFLFVRLARATKQQVEGLSAAHWLTLAGALIAVAGVVDLIWTQVQFEDGFASGAAVSLRWYAASLPLVVIAAGLLVSIAAQILLVVQARRPHESN